MKISGTQKIRAQQVGVGMDPNGSDSDFGSAPPCSALPSQQEGLKSFPVHSCHCPGGGGGSLTLAASFEFSIPTLPRPAFGLVLQADSIVRLRPLID